MSASLFENKPECCPFGHQLWPGRAQVGWKPCICEPGPGGCRARPRHGTRPSHVQQVPRPAPADGVLRAAARQRAPAAYRLGDGTRSSPFSASATTARATAIAAGRSGAARPGWSLVRTLLPKPGCAAGPHGTRLRPGGNSAGPYRIWPTCRCGLSRSATGCTRD